MSAVFITCYILCGFCIEKNVFMVYIAKYFVCKCILSLVFPFLRFLTVFLFFALKKRNFASTSIFFYVFVSRYIYLYFPHDSRLFEPTTSKHAVKFVNFDKKMILSMVLSTFTFYFSFSFTSSRRV